MPCFSHVLVVFTVGPFLLPCYQLGSQPSTAMFHSEENGSKGMDPLVLIDAIAICMAYEEKELCKIGEVALAVIFDVASIILGSKERVRLCKPNIGMLLIYDPIQGIDLKRCLLLLGLPASPVLLHRRAALCVLLRAGLVRQAGWSGVH